MYRSTQTALFLIAALLLVSCDSSPTSEPEPLEFSTEPSSELEQIIQSTPSDFTWGFYNDNVVVQLNSGSDWSGEVVVSAFQVQNGEVVHRATSDPVETSLEELSGGVSTGDLIPESQLVPQGQWVSVEEWQLSSQWTPSSNWTPSELEDAAVTQSDLGENQTMVVAYAQQAGDSEGRDVTSQPFGIIFQQQTTGSLEVITTTSGSDSDGYTLNVDGTTHSMGTDDTTQVSGLSEGSYQAELTGLDSGCSVNGNNPRSVNITAGQTTSTTFEVNCEAKLGNQIAFDANLSDSNEILAINPDGTNDERITENGSFDAHPVISPNGTEIAFYSSRNNGSLGEDVDLFVMNADGSDVREVKKLSTFYGYFGWSPDGEKLVYGDAPNGTDNLYVINVDGTGQTQLTSNSGTDVEPNWSPDGNQIVFASNRDGDYDLYTIDPNGDNLQRVTDDQYDNQQPRWSPDGSKIAFTSDREGSWDRVFTIDVENGTITQVTEEYSSNDSDDRWPSWSPDGSEIAFGSVAFDGVTSEIYRVPSDGNGTPEVVTGSFDDNARHPFWSPVQ